MLALCFVGLPLRPFYPVHLLRLFPLFPLYPLYPLFRLLTLFPQFPLFIRFEIHTIQPKERVPRAKRERPPSGSFATMADGDGGFVFVKRKRFVDRTLPAITRIPPGEYWNPGFFSRAK